MRSGTGAAARIKDPAARDFALWYKYRNSPATGNAEAIERFRLSHPDWPGQDELREKAETALFLTDADTDAVKAFFRRLTAANRRGQGSARCGVYRRTTTKRGRAISSFPPGATISSMRRVEKKILDRYGSWLTSEHHRARIDRLLYPDEKGAIEAALRVSKLLSRRGAEEGRGAHRRGQARRQRRKASRCAARERRRSRCRLALQPHPVAASHQGQGAPGASLEDAARCAERAQYSARSQQLVDRAAHQLPRRAERRQPKVAYEIAAKHGLVSGDGYIEAEFLAGWIALRFLNDPNTALRHFLVVAPCRHQFEKHRAWRILARPHRARPRRPRLGDGPFPRRRQVSRNISTVSSAARRSTPSPHISKSRARPCRRRPTFRASSPGTRCAPSGLRGPTGLDGVDTAILPGAVAQADQPGRGRAAGRARQAHRRSADRAQAVEDRLQPRSSSRGLCPAGRGACPSSGAC